MSEDEKLNQTTPNWTRNPGEPAEVQKEENNEGDSNDSKKIVNKRKFVESSGNFLKICLKVFYSIIF